jgi:hypothetical protein
MPTESRIPFYETVCDKPPPPGTVATRSQAERLKERERRFGASEAVSKTPEIVDPQKCERPSSTDADRPK